VISGEVVMSYRKPALAVLLTCSLAHAGLLATTKINMEDCIIVPGQPTVFQCSVALKLSLAWGEDKPGETVEFYYDGRLVGRAITDKNGTATLVANVTPGKAKTFKARVVRRAARDVWGEGRVFYFDPHKTIIAVDMDETVSRTNYSDLFIADLDRHSAPIEGAAAVLTRLSKDYHIIYTSARPRFLNDKTREWLAEHGFPAGPVANALKFEACLAQAKYKSGICRALRARFPNLLIGIGDKRADEQAYGENNMLAIILERNKNKPYGEHCVVFERWSEIERFFETQKPRLSDPTVLASLIRENPNLRPVLMTPPPTELAQRPENRPLADSTRTARPAISALSQ